LYDASDLDPITYLILLQEMILNHFRQILLCKDGAIRLLTKAAEIWTSDGNARTRRLVVGYRTLNSGAFLAAGMRSGK
jgi:hypothetical protein